MGKNIKKNQQKTVQKTENPVEAVSDKKDVVGEKIKEEVVSDKKDTVGKKVEKLLLNSTIMSIKISAPIFTTIILLFPLLGLFKNWEIPILTYGFISACALLLNIIIAAIKWTKDTLKFRLDHKREAKVMDNIFILNVYAIALCIFFIGSSITLWYLPYDSYTQQHFDKLNYGKGVVFANKEDISLDDFYMKKESMASVSRYSIDNLKKMGAKINEPFFCYYKNEHNIGNSTTSLKVSYDKVIVIITNDVTEITRYDVTDDYHFGNVLDTNRYVLYKIPSSYF